MSGELNNLVLSARLPRKWKICQILIPGLWFSRVLDIKQLLNEPPLQGSKDGVGNQLKVKVCLPDFGYIPYTILKNGINGLDLNKPRF